MILSDILQESLRHITPGSNSQSEKFSLNFAALLQKNRRILHATRILFVPSERIPVWDPAITCPSHLYLGIPDDGWLCPAWQLSHALGMGTRSQSCAMAPCQFPMGFKDVTVEFMDLYIRLGKCAIDPEHTLYGENHRFKMSTADGQRVCEWCGLLQYRHERPRTVIDITWEAQP